MQAEVDMHDATVPVFRRRYQVDGVIGAGGMGQVLRAIDRLTGHAVALKQVRIAPADLQFASRPPDADPDTLLLALAHEFRVLASLRHPHIISVLDYGFDGTRQPFFTMELLHTPQTVLQAGRSAARSTQLHLLAQVLEALIYLHRRGILHHDLKPDNVLVAAGQVRLLDFGLAVVPEQTRTSDSFGTLVYLAPEVLDGQPYTVAADLYAVGVLAYELFVGVHPFAAATLSDFFDRVAAFDLDLTPLAAEPAIQAWVGHLLAADPRDRWPSAGAALAALRTATGAPAAAEDRTIRDSFLQAATFVGRTVELAQLRAALAQTVAGRGATWLIGGESGVGKSRLLDELRAEALVAGALVLRGQAVEGGGLPYQLWRDLARHLALETTLSALDAGVLLGLVPDLPHMFDQPIRAAPVLDADGTRQRLAVTISDLLRSVGQPVVLMLEDLQWAAESLALLRLVQRRLADQPVLVIGTYRRDERPDLPAELPVAHVLTLPRLDAPALAALSAAMLGPAGATPAVLDLLTRETEGNAFFAVEVVRALAEDAGRLADVGRTTLPTQVIAGGVEQLIVRRLARVPDAARPLLTYAAVAGRQIDLRVLAALLTAHPAVWPDGDLAAWLQVGADAAVLELADGQWRFAHDKLRAGVLTQITPTARPAQHRAVAEALEAAYPDPTARAPYVDQLREHWQQAGDAARELLYLVPVVEQLVRVTGSLDVAQMLITRGLQLLTASQLPNATALALTLHAWLASVLMFQGKHAAADTVFASALAQADATTYPAARLQLLTQRATFHMNLGQMPETLRAAEEGVQLARQLDDHPHIAMNLSIAGFALTYLGAHPRAVAMLQESLTIYQAIDDPFGLMGVYSNLGVVAHVRRHYPAAEGYYVEAMHLGQTMGAHLAHATVLGNLVPLLLMRGATTQARSLIADGVALSEQAGAPYTLVPNLLNQAALARTTGDWASVAVPLQRARALITEHHLDGFGARSLLEAAWRAWQDGDLTPARVLATASVDAAQAVGDTFEAVDAQVVVGALAVVAGDTTAALTTLDHLLASSATDAPDVHAIVLRLRGQVQLDTGNVAAAVADLMASGAHAHTSALPPLVVESLVRLAVAQARARDVHAAQTSLREAASVARELAELTPLHVAVVLAAAQVAAMAGRITEAARLAQGVVAHPRSTFATRAAAVALVGDRPPPRNAPDLDALLAHLAHT